MQHTAQVLACCWGDTSSQKYCTFSVTFYFWCGTVRTVPAPHLQQSSEHSFAADRPVFRILTAATRSYYYMVNCHWPRRSKVAAQADTADTPVSVCGSSGDTMGPQQKGFQCPASFAVATLRGVVRDSSGCMQQLLTMLSLPERRHGVYSNVLTWSQCVIWVVTDDWVQMLCISSWRWQ